MTEEMRALMEKATAKLDAARLLAEHGFFDDTISRSYYAMFYAAEAALLTADVTASTHKGVHMMFGKHLVKPGTFPSALGKDLVRVFEKRRTADYEGNLARTQEDADEALRKAENFIERIEQYLREPS